MQWTMVAAAFVVTALLAAPAGAKTGEVVADEQAWATSTSTGVPSVGDPVANTTLEQGDLPVGANGTSETKRSYLLLKLPKAATSAQLTLPVSDGAAKNFGAPGPILACAVVGPFEVQSGDPIDEAPEVDCGDEPIVGEVDEDGAYTWGLDPILARWAAGEPNHGVALVADTSAPQPTYQVTFHAEFFAPIGSYTVQGDTSGDSGSDFSPPAFAGGAGSANGDDFESAPPPQSFESFESFDSALAPDVIEQVPAQPPALAAEDIAGESGPPPVAAAPPAPETTVAAAGPLEPLPVNPAVWAFLPLGAGVLWSAGRGLTGRGQPVSALDRLLSA